MSEAKIQRYYYTWKEFDEDCIELACEISRCRMDFSNIYGVPRGGIPIAVRLSSILNLPLVENPKCMHTIIVDDIVDTGFIRQKFKNYFFASIHYKPWAGVEPNFYIHTTEDWIVYPWEVEYEKL